MPASTVSPQRPRLAVVRPRATDLDDASLARAIAEGHPGAPGAAWDRFATLVRGLLRRTIGPTADVEDAVQETFIQLFKDAKNLREPSLLRSFVVGIAVRVARSELRRRRVRRWLWLTDDGAVPDESGSESDTDAREALGRLYSLLDDLDTEGRMLFVLRHIEGLELTQTAEAMGMSLATAKRHLARVTARVHARAERDPLLATYLVAADPGAARGPREDQDSEKEEHDG